MQTKQDSPFEDTELINQLLGVEESFKAPTALNEILLDKPRREDLFRKFLKYEKDLSYDWFRSYFEGDHANRSRLKQDFTPQSIVNVVNVLTGNDGHSYFEPAAGTGGIVAARWHDDQIKTGFFKYRPSMFFYHVEELSDAAMPFLLFNLAIRGMNATVFHGDSLTRECKQVYFIQNDFDDLLQFSSINLMPHSEAVTKEFDVSSWTEDEFSHIESTELSGPVADVIYMMRGSDHFVGTDEQA